MEKGPNDDLLQEQMEASRKQKKPSRLNKRLILLVGLIIALGIIIWTGIKYWFKDYGLYVLTVLLICFAVYKIKNAKIKVWEKLVLTAVVALLACWPAYIHRISFGGLHLGNFVKHYLLYGFIAVVAVAGIIYLKRKKRSNNRSNFGKKVNWKKVSIALGILAAIALCVWFFSSNTSLFKSKDVAREKFVKDSIRLAKQNDEAQKQHNKIDAAKKALDNQNSQLEAQIAVLDSMNRKFAWLDSANCNNTDDVNIAAALHEQLRRQLLQMSAVKSSCNATLNVSLDGVGEKDEANGVAHVHIKTTEQ